MQKKSEFLSTLFAYLNQHVKYAVLRNYEGLPISNPSRDIDIIIGQKELQKHKSKIQNIIIDSGWKIVTYLNNGRLVTYVCGIVSEEGTELVQLDFFLHTSVFGVILVDASEFIAARKYNGQLYHVSEEYEFLDKYLYNRVVGAAYPEKYKAIKVRVESSELVRNKLKQVYGNNNLQELDQMNHNKLLSRALMYNLKTNFFSTAYLVIQSLLIYVAGFLRSAVAPRIGFTGPDGVGKTTVIELLHQSLSPVFEKATEFFHFRPSLLPNLGEAAKSTGIKKEVDRNYNIPHRGSENGKINSLVRLSYYTLDYIIGFWIKVKPQCRLTKVIIFDRYFTDIIADSRRSVIYLNKKFLFYWGLVFIPKLDYNILLMADTEVILSRKQELSREGIEEIRQKLNYLAGKNRYYLLENNGKPEVAVQNILHIIFEKQHQRNLKRLKHGKAKN